jgi:hypothetical protein
MEAMLNRIYEMLKSKNFELPRDEGPRPRHDRGAVERGGGTGAKAPLKVSTKIFYFTPFSVDRRSGSLDGTLERLCAIGAHLEICSIMSGLQEAIEKEDASGRKNLVQLASQHLNVSFTRVVHAAREYYAVVKRWLCEEFCLITHGVKLDVAGLVTACSLQIAAGAEADKWRWLPLPLRALCFKVVATVPLTTLNAYHTIGPPLLLGITSDTALSIDELEIETSRFVSLTKALLVEQAAAIVTLADEGVFCLSPPAAPASLGVLLLQQLLTRPAFFPVVLPTFDLDDSAAVCDDGLTERLTAALQDCKRPRYEPLDWPTPLQDAVWSAHATGLGE